MTHIVALTGISGVGKSTLVKILAGTIPLHHFQASALIKEERDAAGESIAHDHLRLADIDENQQLLVRGFRRKALEASGLILLDGHTIIEREDKLTSVPAAVYERRRGDQHRVRPLFSVERLSNVQDAAAEQAASICSTLGIELHIRRPIDVEAIAIIIRNVGMRRS
jgi:adenylate kinase